MKGEIFGKRVKSHAIRCEKVGSERREDSKGAVRVLVKCHDRHFQSPTSCVAFVD